jgi:DNA-binding IscR family transcriptional regulator
MRLTSKGRYAVRAMLDLTVNSNGNPVDFRKFQTDKTFHFTTSSSFLESLETDEQ